MKLQIKHRYTDAVLYEYESGLTLRQALEKATSAKVDLRGANLRGADLVGADLRGADLVGSNLRGANLVGSNLVGSNLRGADLGCSNLRGSNLRGANLYGSNLRGADLVGADLGCSNLRGADLVGSNLGCSDLRGSNLRGASLGETFGKLIASRPFFQCGPIGSRADYLLSFITDKGVIVKAGCFTGTLDDFRAKVKATHADNIHAKEYSMAILMIESHAALWGAE